MSRIIPIGAIVIATLTRRDDDVRHPGLNTWHLELPAGPGATANWLFLAMPTLLAHMPDRLAAGAPVTLTLLILVNRLTIAAALHVEIRERHTLQELADRIYEEVPDFVERVFTSMPQLVSAQPFEGTPAANAPTTGTPQ